MPNRTVYVVADTVHGKMVEDGRDSVNARPAHVLRTSALILPLVRVTILFCRSILFRNPIKTVAQEIRWLQCCSQWRSVNPSGLDWDLHLLPGSDFNMPQVLSQLLVRYYGIEVHPISLEGLVQFPEEKWAISNCESTGPSSALPYAVPILT